MQDTCYIVMSEYGIERMTKRQGHLKRGEVAVRVSVAIADRAFIEPAIAAHITIPESAIIVPAVTVEVEDAP